MAVERHHHYEDDEMWLSLDELIEVIRMTVQQCLALPDQRLPASERDQIRARLEAGRRRDEPDTKLRGPAGGERRTP